MAKVVLIIDISSDAVRAGIFTATKMEPAGFLTEPIKAAADGTVSRAEIGTALRSVLSSVREMGFEGFERTLLSIPAAEFSIRVVTVPFIEKEKIGEVLPFELAGLLHVDVEETIIESIHLGGDRVLAVALEKKIIREYLDELSSTGIDPFWIGSALFSMPALLKEMRPGHGARAFFGHDSITVSEDGELKFFKPIKRLDGIKLGLAYLEAEGVKLDEVYLAGWKQDDIMPLVPGARIEDIKLPGGYPQDGAGIYALSVQLKKGISAFQQETVNFRKGEFEYVFEKIAERRKTYLTAAIAGALLLLLLADSFVRYFMVSRRAAEYDEALKNSYIRIFPTERNVADEVRSMEAKIGTLKKESSLFGRRFLTLEILSALADAGSVANASMTEVNITPQRVTVKGEAATFEAANSFRDNVVASTLFKSAQLTDLKAGAAGKASFNLTIDIEQD